MSVLLLNFVALGVVIVIIGARDRRARRIHASEAITLHNMPLKVVVVGSNLLFVACLLVPFAASHQPVAHVLFGLLIAWCVAMAWRGCHAGTVRLDREQLVVVDQFKTTRLPVRDIACSGRR